MNMLIIDGYNLMFSGLKMQPHSGKKALEQSRLKLLLLLEQFNVRRKRLIFVVFDNKTSLDIPEFPYAFPNIKVFFSRPLSSADDRILELVEENRQPTAISVVTSDKNIRKNVEDLGSQTITSEMFASKIRAAIPSAKKLSSAEPHMKYSGISSAEADKWLKMFNLAEEE